MLTTPGRTGDPDPLRRLNVPAPLQVEADSRQTPLRVRHRGRWQEVADVREHYRVDDRWWTSKPIARDYFDLLLEDGRPLTIFRDRADGRWYAQRYG